jgi:hypothetical protein
VGKDYNRGEVRGKEGLALFIINYSLDRRKRKRGIKTSLIKQPESGDYLVKKSQM